MNQECPRHRILLVEDDAPLAAMVAEFLVRHGCDTLIERRGDSAVRRILAESPDAVLLDVNLPGLDGFSICRAVRDRYAGVIIMITARGEEIDEVLRLEPELSVTTLCTFLREFSPPSSQYRRPPPSRWISAVAWP